jgi:hypothetical protein
MPAHHHAADGQQPPIRAISLQKRPTHRRQKNAAFGLNPKTGVGRFLAKPCRVEPRFVRLPARLRLAQAATSAKLIQAIEKMIQQGVKGSVCSTPVEGFRPLEWSWGC